MTEPTDVDAVPFERLVRIYMKIRGAVQEVSQRYESELERLKAEQQEVSRLIKDRMLAMGEGTSSVKTDHGTAILSKKTRYYAQDWDAFKNFVLENGAIDLLEKRVAQTNMASFLEENPGLVPPGLSSQTEFDISVRKPSAK